MKSKSGVGAFGADQMGERHEERLLPRPVLEMRKVGASTFANRELYRVLANYRHHPVEIETSDAYSSVVDPQPAKTKWSLGPRSLYILERSRQLEPTGRRSHKFGTTSQVPTLI